MLDVYVILACGALIAWIGYYLGKHLDKYWRTTHFHKQISVANEYVIHFLCKMFINKSEVSRGSIQRLIDSTSRKFAVEPDILWTEDQFINDVFVRIYRTPSVSLEDKDEILKQIDIVDKSTVLNGPAVETAAEITTIVETPGAAEGVLALPSKPLPRTAQPTKRLTLGLFAILLPLAAIVFTALLIFVKPLLVDWLTFAKVTQNLTLYSVFSVVLLLLILLLITGIAMLVEFSALKKQHKQKK